VGVVHSGVLEILVENGVVGFLVFAGIVAATFGLFAANERTSRAAGWERWRMLNGVFEGVFLAALVSGAFETIVKTNNFWLAAATAAVVNESLKRRAARERAELNGALPPAAVAAPTARPV
jgi:O-antigen ligase